MTNRVFFTQFNRILGVDGAPIAGAKVYVYNSGTNTQRDIFSDTALATQLAQPVVADANGLFRQFFTESAQPVRIIVTDSDDVTVDGYPVDNIVPLAATQTGAASIAFNPTGGLTSTNVQAAIVEAAALTTDQTDIFERSLTVWPTGGTGNAYTITPSPAITSYGAWQFFRILPDRANTGAATLNVNGLGAKDAERYNSSSSLTALTAGEIVAGRPISVWYDGTQFVVLDDAADTPVTEGVSLTGNDANNADTFTVYRTDGSTTNLPSGKTFGVLLNLPRVADRQLQIFAPSGSSADDTLWSRHESGAGWSSWYQVATTANTLLLGTTASAGRTALGLGDVSTRTVGAASGTQVPDRNDADLRYCRRSNNLSDLSNASTAQSNLGLGGMAIRNPGGSANTFRDNAENEAVFHVKGVNVLAAGDLPTDLAAESWVQQRLVDIDFNDLGTIAFLSRESGTELNPNSTYSGSVLKYAAVRDDGSNANVVVATDSVPGTWRAMGGSDNSNGGNRHATVFRRIT